MYEWVKLAIISGVAIWFCAHSAAIAQNTPPADNDDSYKLPMYVPKVALPNNGKKIIFNDDSGDNDEIYNMPKHAAPAAGTSAAAAPVVPKASGQAQQNYEEQYKQYQEQMKDYNQKMEEYKKQLDAQQKQSQNPPVVDNDATYELPGQYSKVKQAVKPPAKYVPPKVKVQAQPAPVAAQPAPQPARQAAAPAQQIQPQQQPVQSQYQAPAAIQYNQKYNYSDQYDRAPPASSSSGGSMPSYYY